MQIDLSTLLGFVVLPAVVFALIYPTLVSRQSRGLVSPYVKADSRKRLFAAGADALVVVSLLVLAAATRRVLYGGLGGIYLLLRDATAGQSIGKLLFGLRVIGLISGRPISLWAR